MPPTEPSTSADTEAVATASPPPRASGPRLDADGRERPRFIASFPDDPALNALAQAFERGDFAYVRTHAKTLINAGTTPEIKAAAAELRRRIDPDPSVMLLLGLASAVFAFLVLWVYTAR